MRPVGLALIGVGGYGARLGKELKVLPSCKIVCCYHPDEENARDAATELNCKAVFTPEEAFEQSGVEALILATPDPSHFPYIEAALSYNLHLFVEKPVVGRIDEAFKLDTMLKDYGKVFAVGHNMRRMSAFRFLKKELEAGVLGKPVTFTISLSHGGAFHWGKRYWRTNPELCREGPIRVNGVHASDVLEYLFGPIDEVFAQISNICTPQKSPDSGNAMVRIGDIVGTINTHWNVPSLNLFQFQFSDAQVNFDLKTLRIRYGRDVNCVATEERDIELPEVNVRQEQFEEFFAAIRGEGVVETDWKVGFRAVRFFEACFQSSELNCPILLEDVVL